MTELNVPRHIAIVMDGNGRWAKHNNISTAAGHKAGVETVRKMLTYCEKNKHIQCLTLFAFSSENWQRPKMEVNALMKLFSAYLDSEVNALHERGVALRFIGRRDRFSKTLLRKIEQAEKITANNNNFYLTLAVDYGGQWDIAQACQKIAAQAVDKSLSIADIDEELVAKQLCLSDLPVPDLLIRTSGECRISNFLLWQLAYAEFYFTDVLWPDFAEQDLQQALDVYASRERRFGGRV